jgi:hypothetical protein
MYMQRTLKKLRPLRLLNTDIFMNSIVFEFDLIKEPNDTYLG